MILRPYQEAVIAKFRSLPAPQRLILAWSPGAGKTLASIECAKTMGAKKVLVICPALLRPMWARKMAEAGFDVGAIRWSPSARLTKDGQAARSKAYKADCAVTSYELVKWVRPEPWDFVIIDEMHALRNPRSMQTKLVRTAINANPDCMCLGLSGSIIPNEAKQLWSPVDMFFPGVWGEPSKTGDVSWGFLSSYCHREESSYGVRYYGLKENKRAALDKAFAALSDRVTDTDFAAYLPPLFVEPLFLDEPTDPVKVALDWYKQTQDEVAHVGIYCHLRETAKRIFDALDTPFTTVILITGDMPVEVRDRRLEECRQCSRSLIIGTTHALNEGVSLSFQKAALVAEWTTSVDQTLQFVGRFARQDSQSNAPTNVQYIVGPNDVGRADKIRERIASINSVLKAGRAENDAINLFRPYEMSEDAFAAEVSRLCKGVAKRGSLWGDEDDGEEEE